MNSPAPNTARLIGALVVLLATSIDAQTLVQGSGQAPVAQTAFTRTIQRDGTAPVAHVRSNATTVAVQSPDLTAFDQYVAHAARDWHVPGLAIAVVKDDSLVFAKGYGVLEIGKLAPVTEHTRFGIASTTKAMNVASLAMLVDEGKLKWDDRVIDHLPNFRMYEPWVTREFTIRDLLTHRSGLPNADLLWYRGNYTFPEIMRRLRYVEPTTSFRSEFEYQNVMYAVAGAVVEQASGMPWDNFVRTRIFAPLGMTESTTDLATIMRQPGVATPHAEVHDTVRVLPFDARTDPIAPAGSVWSSVSDMSKWMRFMLDSGRVGAKRLIKPATFKEIVAPQIRAPYSEYPALELAQPHFFSYALGWFVQDYHGQTVWMHTGSIDGMCAIIGLIPEKRLGVYVLENLDHAELRHALMYKVFDMYSGNPPRDWSTEVKALFARLALKEKTPKARVTGTHPSLPLTAYAGTYSDSAYGTVIVTLGKTGLRLQFGHEAPSDLEYWDYDTFHEHTPLSWAGPVPVNFLPDRVGHVGALRMLDVTFRARAQGATYADHLPAAVDSIATRVLEHTGVPSASVAIVTHGRVTYAQAYGAAKLDPRVTARPDMRYAIGSISKQFTATAILLLQQERKLSLNDHVSRYVPGLTHGDDITIRELLSHTSGYQDYWPQDYVLPSMERPITPQAILDHWAKQSLDFPPGSRWQYSNTNFVIAALIVQKVSGTPFFQFVQHRILDPLKLTSAIDFDARGPGAIEPVGYTRYGLGPLRPAPTLGAGWAFGAGELAMTARDLARWDISMITQSLLTPASYRALTTTVMLNNGVATSYGLGIGVGLQRGHRVLEHSGGVSGFSAENIIFPDDSIAIVVLTNQDAAPASGAIAQQIGQMLFQTLLTTGDAQVESRTALAERIFEGLQHGTINRSLFTPNANFYFSPQALGDFSSTLAPLGAPKQFVQTGQESRGGMLERTYRVTFPGRALRVWTYEMPDGKLEQYQIAPIADPGA